MKRIANSTAWLVLLTGTLTTAIASRCEAQSAGQTAARAAAAKDQHLFILFHRRDDAATQAVRQTLETALASRADQTDLIEINVTDPAEQAMIEHWKLSRAPMPLVLVMAPNRAITGGFPLRITEEQIAGAIVSHATAACLLAAQSQKLVLLCVYREEEFVMPAGVQAFQEDAQYGPSTEVVAIRADDVSEAEFLQTLNLAPQDSTTLTALIAPPGTLLASFPETVTKAQLVTTLRTAQSSCCPGGRCGPGGCRPSGTQAPQQRNQQ